MAFRDRIEAILQAKDVQRFKAGMRAAARAVAELGDEGDEASASLEILERIEEKLERQSEELALAMYAVSESVDKLGDEAIAAAAKIELLAKAQRKSGNNAIFLGKSWAF